jgi:hypothetical protein
VSTRNGPVGRHFRSAKHPPGLLLSMRASHFRTGMPCCRSTEKQRTKPSEREKSNLRIVRKCARPLLRSRCAPSERAASTAELLGCSRDPPIICFSWQGNAVGMGHLSVLYVQGLRMTSLDPTQTSHGAREHLMLIALPFYKCRTITFVVELHHQSLLFTRKSLLHILACPPYLLLIRLRTGVGIIIHLPGALNTLRRSRRQIIDAVRCRHSPESDLHKLWD